MSTRSLLVVLATVVAIAGAILLFVILSGKSGMNSAGSPSSMTLEEKETVLNAVAQSSDDKMVHTTTEVRARMRVIESVAQSSDDASQQQSSVDKLNVIYSLNTL